MNRMNPQLSKKISRPNGIKAARRIHDELRALVNRSPSSEAKKYAAHQHINNLMMSLAGLFAEQ